MREVRHELSRVAIPEKGAREPINQRLESYHRALEQLQARALLEPLPVAPRRAYDGQLAMCDGVNWDGAGTGQAAVMYYHAGQWWPLLDTHHLKWAAPDGVENPHPQYWHRILDMSGVSFYLTTPVAGSAGNPVGPWDGYAVNSFGLTVDPVTGRVFFDGTSASNGIYLFSVRLEIEATHSNNFVFDYFYHTGAPAGLTFDVDLGAQQTRGVLTWTHLATVDITSPGWLELRCVSATSAFTVAGGRTSVYRVATLASGLQASQSGLHV